MTDRRESGTGRLIRLGLRDLDRATRLCDTPRLAPLLQADPDDDLLGDVGRAADPDGALLLLVRILEACDERQYARLVDEWVTAVGLRSEDYGTHSLRRTKASIIYKATGNLRAVQILLGHTKIENTVRYLGVDVEDALTLAEGIEV